MLSPKLSKGINPIQYIGKMKAGKWTYTVWLIYTGKAAWLPEERFIKESQRLGKTF